MKKVIFALVCSLGVLSFTSSENLKNDNFNDNCNLSITISGGPGCIYNNTYPGWCTQENMEAFAANVYATEGCTRPVIRHVEPYFI